MKEYLVDTVFIGGGTPSILEGNLLVSILETLRENCTMAEDVEITIECNPGTVTKEKLLLYKKAGINRLSFGLQSTKDEELKAIGRIHSVGQFLESYQMARACRFDNINIDLMSALPGQTVESYRETLQIVAALHPEHISAYSLIVEDGTKMKERVEQAEKEGKHILPDEDEEREMYYLTKEILEQAGYRRYEISNYAKERMECRHNIGYWKRKDYLGFGVGAASLYKEERYSNCSELPVYLEKMSQEEQMKIKFSCENTSVEKELPLSCIREQSHKLSREEQMEEFMFLGLRLTDGICKKEFLENFGVKYEEIYGKVTEKLFKNRLVIETEENIKLTDRGIDISNYVMSEFLL